MQSVAFAAIEIIQSTAILNNFFIFNKFFIRLKKLKLTDQNGPIHPSISYSDLLHSVCLLSLKRLFLISSAYFLGTDMATSRYNFRIGLRQLLISPTCARSDTWCFGHHTVQTGAIHKIHHRSAF